MSYARWSGESDVYLFADVAGYVNCCGCAFNSHPIEPYTNNLGITMTYSMGDTELHSATEVVAHMVKHRNVGDTIPDYLLDKTLYTPDVFTPYKPATS